MSDASMTRVLHVITGLGRGGAERALVNLLLGGLDQRVHNTVISLCSDGVYADELRRAGITVYSLGLNANPFSVFRLLRLVYLIRLLRPDVLQGWMYHANLVIALFSLISVRKLRVIWNVRNALYDVRSEKYWTRWVIWAHRLLGGRVSAIIYNSKVSREQHELFGFRRSVGLVIPNGFDLDKWAPHTSRREALKQMLGISGEAVLVGHVARYHPMKDHRTFMAALTEVMHARQDVHAVLIGQGLDVGNPDLDECMKSLPSERVHLLGDRGDVDQLMPGFDIFCLSSWSEAFPNVLGEAMACGVLCVTTDVGDCKDMLGGLGVVVPARAPHAMAEALLGLLALPAHSRATLGAEGRVRIEDNYGMAAIVERYALLYMGSHVRIG